MKAKSCLAAGVYVCAMFSIRAYNVTYTHTFPRGRGGLVIGSAKLGQALGALQGHASTWGSLRGVAMQGVYAG